MGNGKSLGFLWKICHATNRYSMRYWLSLPEFKRAIEDLDSKQIQITEERVLNVMQELYDERVKYYWQYPWFNSQVARKALHQIRRHVAEQQSDDNILQKEVFE